MADEETVDEETARQTTISPPSWNEKRICEVIAHYDSQTEEEQAAEIEAACQAENVTMVAVPTELISEVLR